MPLAAIFVWALLVFPAGLNGQATPPSAQQEKPGEAPAAQNPAPSQPSTQSGQPANPGQSSPPSPATPSPDTKPANTPPKKKIVHNGSTTEPTVQISSGAASGRSASKSLHSTDQLLAATDANLKKLSGRQLTPAQQQTVSQIRIYMAQATSAASNGDTQHAYTLAHKASLLATELAGHQ